MSNQEIGIISSLIPAVSGVIVYAVNDKVKDYFDALIKKCGYQAIRVCEPQVQSDDIEPYEKQSVFPNEELKLVLWANEIVGELKKHSNPILLVQSELISEQYSRGYGIFLAELVWCDVVCPTIIASIDSELKNQRFTRRIRRVENNLLNPIIPIESDWLKQTPSQAAPYFIFLDVISDEPKLKDAVKASVAAVLVGLKAETVLSVSKELIEAEMEEISHSIRHKYQNVIASLRLLLGAFTSGDITFSDLQETVEKLECRQKDIFFTRLDDLQKKWILKETEISSLMNASSSEISSQSKKSLNGKIIIIDDEYFPETTANSGEPKQFRNFGWETVHSQLLSNSRRFKFDIVPFNSYDSASEGIDRKLLAETKFIILDINLGDASKSGLLLLHQIRLLHPFVPIIVMTSYDDAKICQLVFEWQADAFFAKQLQDSGNRSSKKYYAKFVETIEFVLADNLNIRSLYERFINNLNFLRLIDDYLEKTEFEIPKRSGTVESRVNEGVTGQLTHLFILLRILDQRHQDAKVKISNLDENINLLITLLLGAINAWLHFPRPAGSELVKNSQWSGEHSESEDLAKKLNIQLVDRRSFIKSIKKYEYLRHTYESLHDTNAFALSLEDICRIAEEFFNLIEASNKLSSASANRENRFLKEAKPLTSFSNETAAQLIKRAADKEKKQPLSHSINSKMGAGAVLAGAYLEQTANLQDDSSPTPFDYFGVKDKAAEYITFVEEECENQNEQPIFIGIKEEFSVQPVMLTLIDDHGTENGWAYVTQLIHNNLLVNNITLEGTFDKRDYYSDYIRKKLTSCLFESDIFFVDLKMPKQMDLDPSVDSGLEVIKLIKTLNPAAIITVLSATSDSVNLRKAIANGAREFFVKEIPGYSALELSEYAKQFADLTAIFRIHPDELSFIKDFRVLLPSLERLVKDINSGKRKNLFGKRDDIELELNANLKNWLGLDAKITDKQINYIIGDYLALLLRRIFFLHSLSREKYLSSWLEYFAASSNINPVRLVHNQISLSCGMLVEWIFNFVGFGLNVQEESVTPGNRKHGNADIQNFLGTSAFNLGNDIWNRRNRRNDLKSKSLVLAKKDSFEIVRDTIKFVNLMNLDLIPIPVKNTFPFEKVSALRQNLCQSIDRGSSRQASTKKLAEKNKTKEQLYSADYRFKERDFPQRLAEIETEISALESLVKAQFHGTILEERHSLLAHLLVL